MTLPGARLVLAALSLIAGGAAQAQPLPNSDEACRAGRQTQTDSNGNTFVVAYPDSLNCGEGSMASAEGASAVGDSARSTALDATSLGRNSVASARNSSALGARANAAFAGSTAVGADAVTTAANQVTLGAAGSSVRVGDIAASTAAQTGAAGIATVDASGTLGRNTTIIPAINALQSSLATQGGQIAALEAGQDLLSGNVELLFDVRDADRRDMRKGIAAAVAIGHASLPSASGRTSYDLNVSTFRGEQAVGGSIMHRLGASTPIAIGLGFSFAGKGNNAARLGLAGEF